jgi:hypothetical protein
MPIPIIGGEDFMPSLRMVGAGCDVGTAKRGPR